MKEEAPLGLIFPINKQQPDFSMAHEFTEMTKIYVYLFIYSILRRASVKLFLFFFFFQSHFGLY